LGEHSLRFQTGLCSQSANLLCSWTKLSLLSFSLTYDFLVYGFKMGTHRHFPQGFDPSYSQRWLLTENYIDTSHLWLFKSKLTEIKLTLNEVRSPAPPSHLPCSKGLVTRCVGATVLQVADGKWLHWGWLHCGQFYLEQFCSGGSFMVNTSSVQFSFKAVLGSFCVKERRG
jgi:hypothetical protein